MVQVSSEIIGISSNNVMLAVLMNPSKTRQKIFYGMTTPKIAELNGGTDWYYFPICAYKKHRNWKGTHQIMHEAHK